MYPIVDLNGLITATPKLDDVSARLDRLGPQIEQLMIIGGSPGLFLGVVTNGEPQYQRSYGFRDSENKLAVDQNTVFPVGSSTKAVTAAALGILVDEGKVTWRTPVRYAMPASFLPDDQFLWHNLTIVDLLCHRAGISWADNLVIGSDNNIHSYYDSVQERIFDPLGMSRSFLKTPTSDVDNISKCYNTLDDLSTAPITCSRVGDDWYMVATAGVRSYVSDLMKLYAAFGTCFNDQFTSGTSNTEGLPLKQVPELMSAKIPMAQPTRNELSYALGWQRIQLPGKMGHIGLNSDLLPRGGMPAIGHGIPSELVLFHQGSMPGLLSFAALIPGTNGAIVVLSNSLALTDVADWVGQLILQELLNVPDTHKANMIDCAKTTVAGNLMWYPRIVEGLEKGRTGGTSPRDLDEYVGTYWDDIHVFKIVATLEDGTLFWAIQGGTGHGEVLTQTL
ncbi:hypothetical protein PG996_005282 [Apiospora saccharicola]|uniref:Beta-lactamase-related domain-containing protein n=1 Tax=Apiospora saccharicola TaxID=335842 RepID=A0ABR1VL02_9PEZI